MPHKRRQPRNPKRRTVSPRADSGYCVFGATVLTDLIAAFTAEAGGVREGADIEYIHRMRVATRRLRAALPLFRDCYTRAEYRRWLSSVKAITQALGEARDADVQIAFLDKYLLGIPGPASGTSVSMIRPFNHQRPLEDPVKPEPPAPPALPAPVLRPGLIGAILQVLRRVSTAITVIGPPAQSDVPQLPPPVEEQPVTAGQQGIECLLLRLQQRRAALQPHVVDALARLEESGEVKEMQRRFRTIAVTGRRDLVDIHTADVYQRAYNAIQLRVMEVFDHEPSVARPDQITEHHEMRKAAKHLRYTMEVFAPLYPGGLKAELKTFKQLQELLGDMHDCDVWVDSLPRFLVEEKERTEAYFGHTEFFSLIEPGIDRLREERHEKRNRVYTDFAAYWNELKKEMFWDRLRDTLGTALESVQSPPAPLARSAEREGPVRIALIADVHANLPALEAVLADAAQRGASVVINAGDLVGGGPFPDEVVSRLRRAESIDIRGNAERKVFSVQNGKHQKGGKDRTMALWTWEALSPENRAYLADIPDERRFMVRSTRLLVTHASPLDPKELLTASTPATRFSELGREAGADIVIVGHSHQQFSTIADGVRFINPGSVGTPAGDDTRACYALLQLEPYDLCHFQIAYDRDPVVRAGTERGLPGRMPSEHPDLQSGRDMVIPAGTGEPSGEGTDP
ncbi:YfcE family phosphodiesterase [Methanosphaerula subterraneus]|uniref:YfcE family phosphodiesterase n=1 Tax=Methanosphaerula subterraneus TaxID=3350244 RepID=UPI003F87A0DD